MSNSRRWAAASIWSSTGALRLGAANPIGVLVNDFKTALLCDPAQIKRLCLGILVEGGNTGIQGGSLHFFRSSGAGLILSSDRFGAKTGGVLANDSGERPYPTYTEQLAESTVCRRFEQKRGLSFVFASSVATSGAEYRLDQPWCAERARLFPRCGKVLNSLLPVSGLPTPHTPHPESTIASTLRISTHLAFSDMKLGFIGTGEITSSIVTGLCSSPAMPHSIRLSPRNAAIAKKLANRFNAVSISSSNQEVLDHCDTIVIAVRPQVARDVLSELHFRPEHQVVSLVSALSLRSVSEAVAPAVRVTRAVPLPSTAKRLSPTGIYPPEPAACELFVALGTVFAVESEDEFDAICAVTATIAAYFAFIEGIDSWLAQHGIPESKARDYIARMFWGLAASAVDAPERSFQSLAANHATAGGINEQFLRYLIEHGLLTNVSEALDAVLSRISAPSESSDVGTAYYHHPDV